jgi:hypothetical protein
MLWPSKKKMTAKTTINRSLPIPNQAEFRPAGAVVFIGVNLHHRVALSSACGYRSDPCVHDIAAASGTCKPDVVLRQSRIIS